VARAATAAAEPQARHRDVKCLIETSGTPSPVPGDPTRLGEAIEHVVRNGVLFSQPGSTVRVLVTYAGSGASVQVVDEGVGIPSRELPHVLERFYRGRYAREDAVAGVGLGLSIAHDIVTAHGGSLTVTSDGTGRGTTVRIALRS
jgi:signal transduction histidine kinase